MTSTADRGRAMLRDATRLAGWGQSDAEEEKLQECSVRPARPHLRIVRPVDQDVNIANQDVNVAKAPKTRHDGSTPTVALLRSGKSVALPAEVAVNKAIVEYRPRFMPPERWEPIALLVREAVTKCEGKTPHGARVMLGSSAALADYCHRIAGVPLEIKYVFRHDMITAYVNYLGARTEMKNSSRATHRSRLMRMADVLMEGQQVTYRLPGLRGADVSVPYTRHEQVALRSWANGQSRDTRRISANVLLAATWGASLTTSEVLLLTARHVLVDADGVLISVPGKRPRSVPVLAEWESVIADVAQASWRADQWLFRPKRTAIDGNQVANFLRDCNDKPFIINVQRLRATWIVTQLIAGTPIQAILDASGIETIGALGRYMAHVPGPDPDEARALLTVRARAEGCTAPVWGRYPPTERHE